jgi:hypothetical protein
VREQGQVLWGQLLLTLTLRRLSPWRSFTQPVYQLEGLRGWELRKRVRQIRSGKTRAATAVTSVFGLAESILTMSVLVLLIWLAPGGYEPNVLEALSADKPGFVTFAVAAAYAAAVSFIEPFYVAAGFALYLNRRVELEAWDIEQEFRRAFGA